MIAMIESLIDLGNAYEAEGCAVQRRQRTRLRRAVAPRPRVDGRRRGSRSRRSSAILPTFVLEAIYSRDDRWDFAGGPGPAGWHIECAAMIRAHLGETIDIHGGGIDLVFRTTRMKSRRAAARTAARRWRITGCTTLRRFRQREDVEERRNVVTPEELLKSHDGEVLRLACCRRITASRLP